MWKSIFLSSAIAVGLSAVAPAYAQEASRPLYKLDRAKERVVQLSNLSPGDDCHAASIGGRVVKRTFDEQGIWVTGFTLEHPDGSRTFINVSVELDELDRLTAGWVSGGLQTLLKEGNRVAVGAKFCGAAGRVVVADSIRLSARRR